MHVFNGCVKVFIFSSISGPVSCIARVFSSFLAAGWLAGYGWAGWLLGGYLDDGFGFREMSRGFCIVWQREERR